MTYRFFAPYSRHERGGQALRGSSELHAWGDSNLYVRRTGPHLHLSIEHRAAPGTDRLQLTPKVNPPALALEVIDQQPTDPQPPQPSARLRIEQILAEAKTLLSQRQLRDAVRMRASHVAELLAQLIAAGRVTRSPDGYRINRSA